MMYPRGHVNCQPGEEGGEIIKNNSPEIRREVKNALWYSEMLMTRKGGSIWTILGQKQRPLKHHFQMNIEGWRDNGVQFDFPFASNPFAFEFFLWSVWHVCLKHTCLCISFCCEIHGLEKPAWDCCSVCAHMWLRREFGELAAFTSASVYFEVCLSLDWWLKHFFGSEGLFGTEPQNRTFFLQSQISK